MQGKISTFSDAAGFGRNDATTRQFTVTAVRLEIEPIAHGTEGGYSREERKAAFSILNALEPLERDAPEHELDVPENWHQALHEPSVLKAQIVEVRERVAELDIAAQEQSLDRGISRGTRAWTLATPEVRCSGGLRWKWQARRAAPLEAGYR